MTKDRELMGEAAPPMANGELVFEAPWQSRVFGMARALCEQGHFDWEEFRVELIREIGEWEAAHGSDDSYEYYELFLAALTHLMDRKSICASADVSSRAEEFSHRPHGHDH